MLSDVGKIAGMLTIVALVMVAVKPGTTVPQMIDEIGNGWQAAVTSLLHTGTKTVKQTVANVDPYAVPGQTLAQSNAYSSSHYGYTTDNMGNVVRNK